MITLNYYKNWGYNRVKNPIIKKILNKLDTLLKYRILIKQTITQQMQTLNILLTIAGTEGRDTTWKSMV